MTFSGPPPRRTPTPLVWDPRIHGPKPTAPEPAPSFVPRRVQLESPYAGRNARELERNKRYLRRCLRDSLLRGEAPYASHAIYPGALDDTIAEERKRGIAAGFAYREVTVATVVYHDMGVSAGMKLGIEVAEKMGHPVEWRKIGVEPLPLNWWQRLLARVGL